MRRNVAILLFNEVEVLDFAGPFEVFAVTDELADSKLFNVHTVADVPGTIRTRNGLLVIPEHTFESAPAPDIIIVPGGVGTRAFLKKPSVIDWIRRRSRSAQVTASVCTGALVLAQAGLLDGLAATTHYENLDDLARLAPKAQVSGDRRFHDHGSVATAAGISAGIDLSLHLVARLVDPATASKTARYMEYHWRNDHGAAR